jgi:hypothetical protein
LNIGITERDYIEVKGRWGKNPVRIFEEKRYHFASPYYSNQLGMLSNAIWNYHHPEDPVLEGEIVHHKNEITTDDRIDNYEKLTRGQHMRLHEIGCHNGPHTEEAKQKMSASHLGKPIHSEEHKKGLSLRMKEDNPMYRPEVRKKLSEVLIGRVFSEETLKKMSESSRRASEKRWETRRSKNASGHN